MSGAINRRELVHLAALFTGGAMASRGLLSAAFAQENARIRFGGYVESQEQLAQTIAVLKAYEARNPGVEIVPEFTSFSAFTDKLATEAAGGNAPDMFSVNVDLLAEYARRGVIAPLDGYVPEPINLADYADGGVKADHFDGKLYAIPNDAIAPTIITNLTSFEKAAIDLPPEMFTWEDLADVSVKLTDALGPRFWGLEDAGGNYIPCDIFLRGMGKSMFTADHRFGFEPEDLARWYAYWEDLRQRGGVPPGDVQALASSDDPSTSGIVTGRAAMNITLTDSFAGFQALTQDTLVLHMLPNGFADGGPMTQHHYSYAGNSTAVWEKSPYKDRIIDIVHFMHFDPEGIELYYRDSGMVPASSAGREALAREGTDADRKIVAYLEVLQQNPAAPRYPGVTGMSGMLRRANEGVAFGQLTPMQAAEQFIAEAKPRL